MGHCSFSDDRRFLRALSSARSLLPLCNKLPVSLPLLADELGVHAIEGRVVGPDGSLVVEDGKIRIEYLKYSGTTERKTWRRRTRFTIAHELGHLLLDPSLEGGKHRLGSEGSGACSDDQEELFANRIASELLMPESFVLPELLKKESHRWPTLRGMSEMFDVSMTAMIRRLMEITGVIAVWIRIRVDGPEAKGWKCLSSHGVDFAFQKPLDDLARELLEGSRRLARHDIPAFVQNTAVQIPAVGHMARAERGIEYWVVAWMPRI